MTRPAVAPTGVSNGTSVTTAEARRTTLGTGVTPNIRSPSGAPASRHAPNSAPQRSARFGRPARGSGCSETGRTRRSTRAPNWPFGAPDPSSRVVESGAEDPGSRRGLWIRCRCCSDRSNFGEPLDCVLVVPADGGFPCRPRLRGDVVRRVVETGSVVGQHQVEVGDVDVRLVPVDQRDPICGYADVARVGVAVDDAGRTPDEPRPRGSA